MELAMIIPVDRLALFQRLIDQHGLKLKTQPFVVRDTARVAVVEDSRQLGSINAFLSDWQRFSTPIRETSTPVWRRLLRRALSTITQKTA